MGISVSAGSLAPLAGDLQEQIEFFKVRLNKKRLLHKFLITDRATFFKWIKNGDQS